MIRLLPLRFDTDPLLEQLEAHPEVWNEYRWRTEHPRSPHREVDDIWLRYSPSRQIERKYEPHESVWYPVVEKLSAVRDICDRMMTFTAGKSLGGVLITRVPPGRQVYPHADGGWHAEYYEKFAVLVQGNSRQEFCFDSERLGCEKGDSFEFQNHLPHWVTNETDEPRITLIICIRRAP